MSAFVGAIKTVAELGELRLAAECDRCVRYHRTVTVALLRVQNATVAESLARTLRPMDLVTPMATDTYLVILPELGRNDGRVAVERLVDAARSAGAMAQCAIAVCPDDGKTAAALLERLQIGLHAEQPESSRGSAVLPSASGMREQLAEIERAAIVAALDAVNGNQTLAARKLGVSRRTIIYKMEKYGLKPMPGR